MNPYRPHWLKQNPFVRLLLPLMAGITVQEYFPLSIHYWAMMAAAALLCIIGFFFTRLFTRFNRTTWNGLFITILFFAWGGILTWQQDIRQDARWFGNNYNIQDKLVVTLQEPPVEKAKSWKTEAAVNYLVRNNEKIPVHGKIIIYFKKDSLLKPEYGRQLIFSKPLQEIKNSGNPGSFDYKRYTRFQGITHQVYLTSHEAAWLSTTNKNRFNNFLFQSRENIIHILQRHIPGEKERGLAEAMLIGYKNDLDQSLVQSYTNTGVVHIIAISGLHLGLIYWLLQLLLRPLQKRKKISWVRPVAIIACLWLFSLLAGAQPSVLRSAVMFSFIVLGESLARKTSIYNTLAASAFLLLCINPYWLWDVGFQLSYTAVLSIVIFMRPVYNLLYIKNKLLDTVWKMNAVTIAAQVLTVPMSIYYFHQFPNFFLLTNFVAVPLSSAILLGEIFLCAVAFIPGLAAITGSLLAWLIRIMNRYIEKIESIPFSLWNGLQINLAQTFLLYIFIAAVCWWLMEKSSKALQVSLLALLCFMCIRTASLLQANHQGKIVVYNVPGKKAMDIIKGRQYQFAADSLLLADEKSLNFHLKPARILYRTGNSGLFNDWKDHPFLQLGNKKIMFIDHDIQLAPATMPPTIDLLILSGNPRLYIKKLAGSLSIARVVFDSSVPAWKSRYWKKDCDSLHIPWHDVTMNGAFVMNLQ